MKTAGQNALAAALAGTTNRTFISTFKDDVLNGMIEMASHSGVHIRALRGHLYSRQWSSVTNAITDAELVGWLRAAGYMAERRRCAYYISI